MLLSFVLVVPPSNDENEDDGWVALNATDSSHCDSGVTQTKRNSIEWHPASLATLRPRSGDLGYCCLMRTSRTPPETGISVSHQEAS